MSLLMAIPAFAALPTATLDELGRLSRPVRYGAGEVIRLAGEPTRNVLLLLTGTVSSVYSASSGAEVWPAQWHGPAIVDKPSILHGGVQVMDLIATTASTGRWLPRDHFFALLERQESVRAHVLDHLAQGVLTQRAWLATTTMPAVARIATWLLARQPDAEGTVWRGSQEELGYVLGLSRVTVNRVLQRLVQAGCVQLTPRAIRVVNDSRLNGFLAMP